MMVALVGLVGCGDEGAHNCTVTEQEGGLTSIVCPDGSTAVVQDGQDGQNGSPGAPVLLAFQVRTGLLVLQARLVLQGKMVLLVKTGYPALLNK